MDGGPSGLFGSRTWVLSSAVGLTGCGSVPGAGRAEARGFSRSRPP